MIRDTVLGMPPVIDRISPTFRPKGNPAGYQKWRDLLFLHWEVPSDLLQSLLPKPLVVDEFEGRAFVGLVPFAMQSVRPRWWNMTSGFDFLETNLRTYVVHQNMPGVYFFSLDANSITAVLAAYLGWSLPYYVAKQSMARDENRILYSSSRWNSKASVKVDYTVGEYLGPSQALTLEHFLLERYLLFVKHAGVIHSGQVYHTPYPANLATIHSVDQTMLESMGFPGIHRSPDYAHYSEGVDVEVFPMMARP